MSDQGSFKIKQFALAAMLEKATGALGGKSNLEILKSFKFTIDDAGVRCAATDTDLTVLASNSAIEVICPGSLVLPADKMSPIAKNLANDDLITIEPFGDKKARVSTSDTYWIIRSDNPDDYPPIPDPQDAQFECVDRSEFAKALQKVSTACAQDGMRPELMVVDVSTDKIRATDGVRFHSVEMACPFPFQLPLGAITELMRFLRLAVEDQIGIAQVDEMLLFRVDADILMAAAVSTTFPNIKTILASTVNNNRFLVLDRDAVLGAVARVRVNADKDTHQLELIANSTGVVVRTSNKLDETSEHRLVAEWQYPDTRVVLNANHLVDAFKAHDSKSIKLAIGENETTPVAVLGDRGTTVIIRQLRL